MGIIACYALIGMDQYNNYFSRFTVSNFCIGYQMNGKAKDELNGLPV